MRGGFLVLGDVEGEMEELYTEAGYAAQNRCAGLVDRILETGHLTGFTCEELRRRVEGIGSDNDAEAMETVLKALEGAFSVRNIHFVPMGDPDGIFLKRARAVVYGKAVVGEMLIPGAMDLGELRGWLEAQKDVSDLIAVGEKIESLLGEVVGKEYEE